MDVSPCNSLFDLRFVVLVPSKTLNGSSKGKKKKKNRKAGSFSPAFFILSEERKTFTISLYLDIERVAGKENDLLV
jgi:hypothetical protein